MARNVINFRQIESVSHVLSVLSGEQAHNGFPVVTGAPPALPSDQQAEAYKVQESITVRGLLSSFVAVLPPDEEFPACLNTQAASWLLRGGQVSARHLATEEALRRKVTNAFHDSCSCSTIDKL